MKTTNKRNRKGSNQYRTKRHPVWRARIAWTLMMLITGATIVHFSNHPELLVEPTLEIISPVVYAKAVEATASDSAKLAPEATPTPEPTPTELELIVAYIARKFEPEGKDVVVRAINCFYSESGLRRDAVGQNSDGPRSKDWGPAQLNDYWHKLTPEQKTEYRANIDKAYEIYKGRGNSFEAWYGKLCNV